jgi:hypothetical protein
MDGLLEYWNTGALGRDEIEDGGLRIDSENVRHLQSSILSVEPSSFERAGLSATKPMKVFQQLA